MEKKKLFSLIIIAIIAILFYVISQITVSEVEKFDQQERDLFTAIVLSGCAIILHYSKKRPNVREDLKETADSLELLIILVAPMITSFQIATKAFHNFYVMPIIVFVMMGIWYVLCLIQIGKFEVKDKEGAKRLFYTNTVFFALFIVLGILATIVGYILNPFFI